MEQSKPGNVTDTVAKHASSFAAICDLHVEETYRFVHRRCRDNTVAEDVTCETFVEAIRSIDDPNSISIGWLLTAARKRLIDVLRRHDRGEVKLRLVGPVTEDDDTIEPGERRRVVDALSELSLDRRLLLLLHYLEGLTVPAIADYLDRSAKSIDGSVQQARRELRATLDEGSNASPTGPPIVDDVAQLLCSIEGGDPSPDFVTSLRERIVAEMSMAKVPADDDPVVEIHVRPNERET